MLYQEQRYMSKTCSLHLYFLLPQCSALCTRSLLCIHRHIHTLKYKMHVCVVYVCVCGCVRVFAFQNIGKGKFFRFYTYFPFHYFFFLIFCIIIFFFTLQYCIGFAIHQHASPTLFLIKTQKVLHQEQPANLLTCKAFDCVDHNKLWKILKKMGKPDQENQTT